MLSLLNFNINFYQFDIYFEKFMNICFLIIKS